MRKIIIFGLFLYANPIYANDSTGYVGTGGVQYLKNKNITMQSEALFISKQQVRVDYQFKNLTAKDITETILFPLPKVESYNYSDYADVQGLINSFRVQVNGKTIQPKAHVRAFLTQSHHQVRGEKLVDVTANLKACGLTERELMNPWFKNLDSGRISAKIIACKDPQLSKLLQESKAGEDEIRWHSQVIYSWPQTFKANALTRVQHQYRPLVGGSVAISLEPDSYESKAFCIDQNFRRSAKAANMQHNSYSALAYILTTGANWAKPIENFQLTIEREPKELVSLCWQGKIERISPTQFQIKEKNFSPRQDLEILFLSPRNYQ